LVRARFVIDCSESQKNQPSDYLLVFK